MGISYPSGYTKSPDVASAQQRIEARSTTATDGPSVGTQLSNTMTIVELILSLESVNRKVAILEGRMRNLEASFETLFRKTAELNEELRLTQEQLAMRNQVLILLENSRTESRYTDILEETERLRLENANNVGGR